MSTPERRPADESARPGANSSSTAGSAAPKPVAGAVPASGTAGPSPAPAAPKPAPGSSSTPPSLVPGVTLLTVAAVLIVFVFLKPNMPGWLKATVVVLALLVVVALVVYSVRLVKQTKAGIGR